MPDAKSLRGRVAGVYGTRGAEWLEALPGLTAELAVRWGITVGAPFEAHSLSCVAPAVRGDGTRLVLKLSLPETGAAHEALALSVFDGRGAVRLEAADPEQGALLLERAEPGSPLATLCEVSDGEATEAAAAVIRRLRRRPPAGHSFPLLADWVGALDRATESTVTPMLRRACVYASRLADELSAGSAGEAVLHGDLHHHNILAAGREQWLAIDPKGLVGPPEAEAAALLRNPRPFLLGRPDRVRLVSERVRLLAAGLNADAERVKGWGFVLAVLAAWWAFEDGEAEEVSAWLECAEVIRAA
jgi:streptomycin 6-kinase